MNKIACQYAIIRFAPFVETGEFANAGVLMIAPKQRYFGFLLETKRHGRITRFFDELDAKVYKNALYNLKDELERADDLLKQHGFDKRFKSNDVDFANGLFNEITRTRETIIRFSEVRTVLAEDPNEKLKELFGFYVERIFVNKKYQEQLLETNVRKLLFKAHVGEKFVEEKIGDAKFRVRFPFVEHLQDENIKVIKPLYLGQDDSTKIYEHGNQWAFRINKLKNKYINTDQVLFALNGPDSDDNRLHAYHEVEQDLIKTGVQVTTIFNENEIVDFALR